MKNFYHPSSLVFLFIINLIFFNSHHAQAKGVARHSLSEQEYVQMYFDLKKKGYRIKQVDGYAVNGQLRFSAMWFKTSGPNLATFHKMNSADFDAKAKSYMQQGYQMSWISAYKLNNRDYYAAIWEKKSGPRQIIRHRLNSQQYTSVYFDLKNKGYRLAKISAYARSGQAQFAAIWEKKSGPQLATHHMMSSTTYNNKFREYANKGFQLSFVSAFTVNNQDYYAAIWEKRSGKGIAARHRLNASNYAIEFDNHYYSGFNLKMVSGYQRNGKAQYAAIWEADKISGRDLAKINRKVDKFMKDYNIPGLQVAIGKDERLVFARGYGKADKAKNVHMGPRHKARIASISKVFTAVGIMRLAEKRNDFSIDQRVFGPASILGNAYADGNYSNFERQMQVVHLLEHTAGGNKWDNNTYKDHLGDSVEESPKTGDPMLTNDNRSQNQLINDFLKSPVSESNLAPGRYYAYSNFGYILLGKIIAKKSGQSYQNWIQNNILKPSGVRDMFVSKTAKADKRASEVRYYGNSSSDDPYSKYNIERMAAHGGWAASVIDLSKINVRIDGKPLKRDIISKRSFDSMMKQDSYSKNQRVISQSSTRCKGWEVWDSGSFMHGGSLPGTYSRLKNRPDGYFYAIIINANPRSDDFSKDFRELGDHIIKLLDKWPSHDLMN